jgi:hypothetical protein
MFSGKSGAIWTGTARELFGKKNRGMQKVIMAYCRVVNGE